MTGGPPPSKPRRRHARVAARIEVGYEDPSRQVFFSTRDLSEGGVYLEAPDPPEPGRRVRLLFELPGQAELLRLDGRVTRSDPRGFAVTFDDALPEGARRALRSFVSGE